MTYRRILRSTAATLVVCTLTAAAAVTDCFPKSLDDETGSVTATERTQWSLVNANGEGPTVDRGYMVFGTAGIPDGATINSVQLWVFRYADDQPWWYITRLSADPRVGAPGLAFDDIGYTDPDGYYLYTEETSQPPGWYSYALPSQAATDLQDRLPDDWFGVGFHEPDPSGLHYIRFTGWYELEQPYITVDYTPPAVEELTLAVNGHVDPRPQDDWVEAGTTRVQLLWSRPEGAEIDSIVFAFSTDVQPWTPFWTDLDGGELFASTFWPSEDSGDGWSGYFDSDLLVPPPAATTPLHFRADVHTTVGLFQGIEDAVFDPTPPHFTIDVEDGQLFTDSTTTVNIIPEHEGDAANVGFNDVDTSGTVDKGVPRFCQFKPEYPRAGSAYCGPCAAAACLRYFDTHGNPGMVPDGVDDDSLVEEMAGHMQTNRDCRGTNVSRAKNGMKSYLNVHGQLDGYDVQGQDGVSSTNPARHWKKMQRAIELCYDVLPMIVYPQKTTQHWVTATGVRVCDGKI